jgi:hypothetical protein
MRALAMELSPEHADFLLTCAKEAGRMWDGGNQWARYAAFVSFFRHVVKLPLDYSQWRHYETLAHFGPRIMHRDFCMISERPAKLRLDEWSRPHCEDGPFCEWRDGSALYAWHGVYVPAWIIVRPERITVERIAAESNAEVRRAMIEKRGYEWFVRASKARVIDRSRWGTLWEQTVGDERILCVEVENPTPEPDGSHRRFFLPVHPELRPMFPDGELGKPQRLTARNAVASTWGLRGHEIKNWDFAA